MIEVRCYSRLQDLAFLRQRIDALNLASSRPDPFSTFAFYENYLANDEYCAPGETWPLWFLTAFIDDRLVGYLALKRTAVRAWGLRAWKIDCLVTHDTDRPHLVAEAAHEAAVSAAFYEYLLSRRREWSMLEFQQQPDGSPLFPPPIPLKHCLLRQWPSLENGTIRVAWASLDDYFHAFSKKFRSNVSRQMRSLLAAGTVEVLSSSDPALTPILFELCLGIEPHSWKSRANAAVGRHPRRVDYFRGLLDPRQPMRLAIHVVLLDGIPCAALITGRYAERLYALHIVYEQGLQRLGPGSAVLLLGMREAIATRCAVFNLLSGFGYYKQRWLAEMTPACSAQIYRAGSLLYWRRLVGDLRRRLQRTEAAQPPALFNATRRTAEHRDAEHPDADADTGAEAPRAAITSAERQRIARLVAQAKAGRCECLGPDELAALLPFETRRRPAPESRAGQRSTARAPPAGSAVGMAAAAVLASASAGSSPPA